MPRRLFRKYLPSHATIRTNRYIARLGSLATHHNLWHFHRRSVAGGVAVGLFAGLVPGSNPVQFTAAALLAALFHVNLPVAVLVTLYTNPLTVLPLYYVAFRLGQLVLLAPAAEMPSLAFDFKGMEFSRWLPAAWDWVTSIGKPLAVGLPVLATLLGAAGYLFVRILWRCYVVRAWRRRSARTRAPGPP